MDTGAQCGIAGIAGFFGVRKKLIGAARGWAAQAVGEIEVWPDNWPVVEAWSLICDQWRVGAMGGVLGLDWSAVKVLLKAQGVKLTKRLVRGLRMMEREARQVLNEQDRSGRNEAGHHQP